ncbi:MAG: DUF4837 family protein [Candidatus Cloacimonetes bacterium]|jgi:hypothetical protein|nr:DUF4837 family protein [Candidatus Cloacimonadota bacterium]MBT6994894.1 DUF4837 family protein [Candidatus Cloacimonadota bacterium]MBT7468839.1 DUF4837 family protein [Candidatus Cloacimonadota bacterium]
MSWGHKQTVYVFADDNVWKYAKKPLMENLERFHFTTENESYFELKRAENIEQFYKFNNLIFFCDWQSNDQISEYVKKQLGKQIEPEIKRNSVAIYPKDNLWANDQFVLFLIGDNERNLLTLNLTMANNIFELMTNKLKQRIKHQIYKTPIYSTSSFKNLAWSAEIPKNYIRYKSDKNFTSFLARLRNKSDRYFSVYSEKIDKATFGREWLKIKRAEISWKYYDEDFFKEKEIKLEKYNTAEFNGWKLSGRWQNLKYAVGGAFQSFAFYDEKSQTAYLIDNSVYFPEGYKLQSLIELEIISNSFKLK